MGGTDRAAFGMKTSRWLTRQCTLLKRQGWVNNPLCGGVVSMFRFGIQLYVRLDTGRNGLMTKKAPAVRWASSASGSGVCPWATRGSLEGSSTARPPEPPPQALVECVNIKTKRYRHRCTKGYAKTQAAYLRVNVYVPHGGGHEPELKNMTTSLQCSLHS